VEMGGEEARQPEEKPQPVGWAEVVQHRVLLDPTSVGYRTEEAMVYLKLLRESLLNCPLFLTTICATPW
jgi:hypothetical protein